MSEVGPITKRLEEALTGEIRRQGILIWLDKEGHYEGFVDDLCERHRTGGFFAPVVAYRGSFLELLKSLSGHANGLDPEPLLIHVPGHNEESIRKTPLLETYLAGVRYRKSLETLIREAAAGRVGPADVDTFLSTRPTSVSQAEEWLAARTGEGKDGFAGYLDGLTLEWVVDSMLGRGRTLAAKADGQGAFDTLIGFLNRHTGLSEAFRAFVKAEDRPTFDGICDAFGAWLLCVEFVHDLTREPELAALRPLRKLSAPLVKTCSRLVCHFRDRHPDEYAALAQLVESNHLQVELSAMGPEDLGKIDTFRREEGVILEGAIKALLEGAWARAGEWAESRMAGRSLWLDRAPERRMAWTLVGSAASLGQLIAQAGRPLAAAKTLEDARAYYVADGYRVDLAHRRYEQQCLKLLESKLPHFVQFLDVSSKLRREYRRWVDQLTEDLVTIYTTEGFLPDPGIQQRTIYEQVVHPRIGDRSRCAYFLLDAFRYEMATELVSELEAAGTTVRLEGRYAELPTITAVGMNALAPVTQNGRMALATQNELKGFKAGEFSVRSPADRVRAMAERSIEAAGDRSSRVKSLTLADVCSQPADKLKRSCSKANLVVVHSKEIDDAGEANVGLATFETWLQQIKSAWHRLHGLGFDELVFTADHGFLLQDDTTQERKYGLKRDPCRRHILAAEARKEEGTVTVSLAELGYDGGEGHLLFARDTSVFSTGNPGASFVHGGPSLQERLIPVLTVSHRSPASTGLAEYCFETEAMAAILGLNRIRMRVKPVIKPGSVLTFLGADHLNVALRVPERSDVRVIIKEATGATVRNQQFAAPVGEAWTEVLFELRGPVDERLKVELFHPDTVERIEPLVGNAYFEVQGTKQARMTDGHHAVVVPAAGWEAGLDEAVRCVFVHLQEHGSITETELVEMLGNARKARRFAVEFETHVKNVPFAVRIESTANGKRYVRVGREGEKGQRS